MNCFFDESHGGVSRRVKLVGLGSEGLTTDLLCAECALRFRNRAKCLDVHYAHVMDRLGISNAAAANPPAFAVDPQSVDLEVAGFASIVGSVKPSIVRIGGREQWEALGHVMSLFVAEALLRAGHTPEPARPLLFSDSVVGTHLMPEVRGPFDPWGHEFYAALEPGRGFRGVVVLWARLAFQLTSKIDVASPVFVYVDAPLAPLTGSIGIRSSLQIPEFPVDTSRQGNAMRLIEGFQSLRMPG